MSIPFDRLIRMLKYDNYLPLKCFASRLQLTNRFNYCGCMIECKYQPTPDESKQTQDCHNSEWGKVRQSQN
jgi:hypothetical protein